MTTGRKITGLPLPETPREAPPEIHGLVEAIEVTLADSDSMEAAQVLGRAFEYLTRYFAGVAGAICQHLKVPGDPSVALDFGQARQQLQDRMESLGDQATDPLSKLVRGVFYVGATRKAPTPRRHARLLDLGGIPIRGYRNIDEWIAIEPGTGDLANESKANRELLRYLPILKEWLTATATFFLDAKQSALSWPSPNELHFTLQAEGATLAVGPVHLPEPLAALLPRDYKGLTPVDTLSPASAAEPAPPADAAPSVAAVEPAPPAEPAPADEPTPAAEPAPADEPTPAVEPVPADEPAPPVEPAPSVAAVETSVAPQPAAAEPPPAAEPAPSGAAVETSVAPNPAVPAAAEPPLPAAVEPPALSDAEPGLETRPAASGVESEPALAPAPSVLAATPLPETPTVEPAKVAAEPQLPAEPSAPTLPPAAEPVLPTAIPPEVGAWEPEPAAPSPEPSAGAIEPSPSLRPDPSSGLADLTVAVEPIPVFESISAPAGAALDPIPVFEPIASVPVAEPGATPLGEQPAEEEDELDLPALDPEAAAQLTPEPAGEHSPAPEPFAPVAEEPLAPEPTPPEAGEPPAPEPARPARPARVAPVLPFQREQEKEKPVPQINVSAPVNLYPVVSGPPPEFFDEIPVDADYPEVLQSALSDLNGAIEANDSLLICGQMQRCFDLMIQFFAGIAAAILHDIDSDNLSEFDVEDGRFDLQEKLELIVSALATLEEYWEGHDAATLVWSVFYDTLLPATDPNSAYLHTRLLGVEGLVPEGFMEFADLCGVVPGKGALAERSACRETAHRYLPILAFWLENATPLFLESEVDFVEEDGGTALSWAASVSGSTLDGTPSGFWLEISPSRWNLPRPELAPLFVVGDAPDVLLPVVDELNASLDRKDYARAGLMVRVGLDFLIQYFAGCAGALWRETGQMSEQAEELYSPEATLEEKEKLLLLSLSSLSTDNPVSASLAKLFSKSSMQYRALIRRDLPSGMGPVAEWAARRDEVGETELLVYLPLVRSWLGAANPWFTSGEQLFEEPTDDGRLEGVVAFGDDFLEMVDPEYVIRLTPENMELVAPLALAEREAEFVESGQAQPREFTGALPPMPILTVGPPLLIGHVQRLLEAGDDRRAANAWLGSAFEYLIQYFAGLCTTVCGGKDAPFRKGVMSYFNPKASLRERELLLVEAISYLKEQATDGTQAKIKAIFYSEDGKLRLHTRYLGAAGPGSLQEDEMLLSFWCRTRHKTGTLNTQEYHFAMAALSSWLDSAKPFFGICEHYAEDPGADGQEEMVVELAEDYLDMVLPDYAIQIPARGYYDVLYRETDAVAADEAALLFPDNVRPELLGPKTTELGGLSDDSGELLLGAATDLGGDDFFGGADAYDSSDLFSGASRPVVEESKPAIPADSPYAKKQRTGTVNLGSAPEQPKTAEPAPAPLSEEALAEAESEAGGRRRKKKRAKKELGTAVLELYKKERLEKARKRAEARARKEQAEPTRLAYKLTYRGLKNSKQLGGRCHFGLIELSNAGGGELKGTIEPSHPSVKVQPSRFEGNEVRVTYQIDPSDMPSTGRVGISLNTQDERIELRMERLVPTSWFRERTFAQALAMMAAPSLVYAGYLLCLVALVLGPGLEQAFNAVATLKEPLAMSVKLKLWIFSVLAILPGATGVPASIKEMFSRFDFTVQEESRKVMPVLMMLPTVFMALVMYGTSYWQFRTPLAQLPVLAGRPWMVVVTLGLNLLAAALFSTQTTVWWEDNSDTKVARRAFLGFWVVTIALGVVATFILSVR